MTLLATLGTLLLVGLGIMGETWRRRRRSRSLRARFGADYAQALHIFGGREHAERALLERSRRVDPLPLRPLGADQRRRYAEQWEAAQALFLQAPAAAVVDADRVLREVMEARGFDPSDPEYRPAHRLPLTDRGGNASTEELRQAMVRYKALLDALLVPDRRRRFRAS